MPVCDLLVARSPQEVPQSFGPPPRMLNLPVRLVLLKYVGQGARIFVRKKKQGKRSLGVFCLVSFGLVGFLLPKSSEKDNSNGLSFA